jgi:D-alanyl-D-alanine carboxypeptidase/D-alanyl-D-alanine-endopeptidase (penicillin-binding protein 4)
MNLRFFTIISLILAGCLCSGQDLLKQKISQLQDDPQMKGAGLGVVLLNPVNGKTVAELNPEISLVPASVLKLATSGAALEILGSDYTFTTKLAMERSPDSTGTLNGNLFIIGGGDPALGSENFPNEYLSPFFLDTWVEKLRPLGIKKIDGDIVADLSIYDDILIPDSWQWGDAGNYYGAGAQAISFLDNSVSVFLQSPDTAGQATKLISTQPLLPLTEIRNYVESSDVQSDNAYVYGPPWQGKREIRGTIPKGRESFKIKASMPEPSIELGKELKKRLTEAGIEVTGIVKTGKAIPLATIISETKSPPLSKIVEVLNHKSVNLYAEHLIKQIAFEKTGVGSTAEGLKIILDFWKGKRIDTRGMFMEDGSGLSRANVVSPRQLAEILKYMETQSPERMVFEKSLPMPGEGTLSLFGIEKFGGDTLRCKTGSMTRVQSLAGYLKTASGNDLIFVLMVNNYSMPRKELMGRLEEILSVAKSNH